MPALPIYSITPFTLLDYPDKSACILWFAGCNMRCVYCYNPDIVTGKGKLGYDDALKFIDRRKGLLDGVVLSGGECTLHKNLSGFIKQLKFRGLQVKVDTNGSAPVVLEKLIRDNLIDYVALDFKAMPSQFQNITQSNLFSKFEKTLLLLLNSAIKFEIRTTVHSKLINEDELLRMTKYLSDKGYRGNYYIQHFINDATTLAPLEASLKFTDAQKFSLPGIELIFRN